MQFGGHGWSNYMVGMYVSSFFMLGYVYDTHGIHMTFVSLRSMCAALSGYHLASRARLCNYTGFCVEPRLDQSHLDTSYTNMNEAEERIWLGKVLKKLEALFASQSAFEGIDFSVTESFNAVRRPFFFPQP